MKIHLKFACASLTERRFFHTIHKKRSEFQLLHEKYLLTLDTTTKCNFWMFFHLFFSFILQLIIPVFRNLLRMLQHARNCHYHTRLRFNRLLNKQSKCKQMQSMRANSFPAVECPNPAFKFNLLLWFVEIQLMFCFRAICGTDINQARATIDFIKQYVQNWTRNAILIYLNVLMVGTWKIECEWPSWWTFGDQKKRLLKKSVVYWKKHRLLKKIPISFNPGANRIKSAPTSLIDSIETTEWPEDWLANNLIERCIESAHNAAADSHSFYLRNWTKLATNVPVVRSCFAIEHMIMCELVYCLFHKYSNFPQKSTICRSDFGFPIESYSIYFTHFREFH